MVSTRLNSISSTPLPNHSGIASSAPVIIGITITFISHKLFRSLARFKLLSLFLVPLILSLWSIETVKYTIQQDLFYYRWFSHQFYLKSMIKCLQASRTLISIQDKVNSVMMNLPLISSLLVFCSFFFIFVNYHLVWSSSRVLGSACIFKAQFVPWEFFLSAFSFSNIQSDFWFLTILHWIFNTDLERRKEVILSIQCIYVLVHLLGDIFYSNW